MYVKERGRITNREYQELLDVSKPTATRDLSELVSKKVLKKLGEAKREIHYELSQLSQK